MHKKIMCIMRSVAMSASALQQVFGLRYKTAVHAFVYKIKTFSKIY